MSDAETVAASARAPHWIVYYNYRLRCMFFGLAFAIMVAEEWGKPDGAATLWMLVPPFLVWPHLAFLRARRSAASQQAELGNLVLDSLLIGVCVASLHFPVWISFTLWLGSSLNIAISRGARAILLALSAFCAGALASVALLGWHFAPQMNAVSTAMCVVGMSLYLYAVGNSSYARNEKLRSTRETLRLREQLLNATNQDVEAAHKNISLMSEFGREITAMLDREAVMKAVYHRVRVQMNADLFRVGIYREERGVIEYPFAVDMGQRLPVSSCSMQEADPLDARCLRTGEAIFIPAHERRRRVDGDAGARTGRRGREGDTPGPLRPASSLYAPLTLKGRVLGMLAVQSGLRGAYEPFHIDMLATLAAYTAVALDNADAYEQLGGALAALKGAQQQLVLKERMASIGTLTAGVAHEINNPVNFAHAGAQTLVLSIERFRAALLTLAGQDADAAIRTLLNRETDELLAQVGVIVEGTTRIRDIVRDLRTFSRLDEAVRKTVSISETLLSTVRLVRMHYAETTEIVCAFERDIAIECWPAQLNQVFMNLIINACDAIAERQRHAGTVPAGLLRIGTRVEAGHLLIDFDDNGCGIPADAIGRIFEPFFTTKSVGQGTGLGLAISYGIVRTHAGELTVRSQPGVGSCFTIQLPLN